METQLSTAANLTKVILMLINLGFIITGALLVYFSVLVRNSGVLDVFQEAYSWLQSATFLAVLIFGVIVVAVSLMGCVGALTKNRTMLLIYAVCIAITMVLFLCIALGGFIANGKANNWHTQKYPVDHTEEMVAGSFNKVYCYSQAGRLCVDGNITEFLPLFLPTNIVTQIGSRLNAQTGLLQVCDNMQISGEASKYFKTMCDQCKANEQYLKYKTFFDWTDTNCPISGHANVLSYCMLFLSKQSLPSSTTPAPIGNGGSNSAGGGNTMAPYGVCRNSFLSLWAMWSNTLAVGSVIVTAVSLIIFIFACSLRRAAIRAQEDHYLE